MNDTYIFEARIVKLGTNETITVVHCMAYNLIQASHIIMSYLSVSQMSGFPEVAEIKKLYQINNLINPYFAVEMEMLDEDDEDGEDDEEGEDEEPSQYSDAMNFKCSCGNSLSVSKIGWKSVRCGNPDCKKKIYRSEIQEVGGLYIYIPKE